MRGRIGIGLTAVVLVILLSCIPVCAASGLSCEYVARSANGTVFYVDVYSDVAVSAAVLELGFDDSLVEHRSAAAIESSSSVRYRREDGLVRIAFADRDALKGKLFRVSFKAKGAGTCRFTLHAVQAADGDLNYINTFSDVTLDVKLGKDDVPAAVTSGRSKTSPTTAKSGPDSRKEQQPTQPPEPQQGAQPQPTAVNLGADQRWTFFALGAGAVVLMAALILLGFLLGRRTRGKKRKQEDSPAENSTPETAEHDEVLRL